MSPVAEDRCLDVELGVAHRSNVALGDCSAAAGGPREWVFTAAGEVRSAEDSTLCLDVARGNIEKPKNRTNVHLFECNGLINQRWFLTAAGELRTASAPELCLDVARGNLGETAPGTNIHVFKCNGLFNQRWGLSGQNPLFLTGKTDGALQPPTPDLTPSIPFTYYDVVDPEGKRTTLEDWKKENGFDIHPVVNAQYINGADLGFGRDMYCTNDPAKNNWACYVDNYLDPNGESVLAATVTMERQRDSVDGHEFVAFFVYDAEGKRIDAIALDSEGPKSVPESCFPCHGGYEDQGKFYGGQFLPFDLNSFVDWKNNPVNPTNPKVRDQEAALRGLNAHVHGAADGFKVSLRELIERWYKGDPSRDGAPDFSDGVPLLDVPILWETFDVNGNHALEDVDDQLLEEWLYDGVYAKYCRTCHVAQAESGYSGPRPDKGLDWAPPRKFDDFDEAKHGARPFVGAIDVANVCKTDDEQAKRPLMPHAEVTFHKLRNEVLDNPVSGVPGLDPDPNTTWAHLCNTVVPRLKAAYAQIPGECDNAPTYNGDVKSILDDKCISCHKIPPAGGAPNTFTLEQYDDAGSVKGAKSVANLIDFRVVEQQDMPLEGPLPQSQRNTIRKWFECGAPRGGQGEELPIASP